MPLPSNPQKQDSWEKRLHFIIVPDEEDGKMLEAKETAYPDSPADSKQTNFLSFWKLADLRQFSRPSSSGRNRHFTLLLRVPELPFLLGYKRILIKLFSMGDPSLSLPTQTQVSPLEQLLSAYFTRCSRISFVAATLRILSYVHYRMFRTSRNL